MRRIIRFTTESVFNTFDNTPAIQAVIPLDTPNNFKPLTVRPVWTIQDASGQNVPRLRGSEILQVQGKFTNRAWWDSAQLFVLWLQRINANSPAGTIPWPTDQKPYDLASASVDFGYSLDDESMIRYRWTGCKPGANVTISSGNDPANPFLNLDYDMLGCHPYPNPYSTLDLAPTTVTFPEPSLASYPLYPITFQESFFIINGTTQSFYDRFSIAINNKTQAYYDNGRFPNRIHMRGRTVTLTVHPLLTALMNPRVKYEAVQALGAMSILFVDPLSGHQLKFDFRSQSFLDSINEDMVLDMDAYADWTATAFLDVGAGDDFKITWT
jgi:hypothetical protein